MDASRAKQIMEADEYCVVQLEGDSVWIEKVDEASGMVTVSMGNHSTQTKTVSVNQLVEVKE